MKGSIRTAVIGMGNMGSQYAALLAAGQVPGMELAAVTRVRPEMLAARGLVLPAGLPVYPTADALFAAVDRGELALDAVIIATPAPPARAAGSGRHAAAAGRALPTNPPGSPARRPAGWSRPAPQGWCAGMCSSSARSPPTG